MSSVFRSNFAINGAKIEEILNGTEAVLQNVLLSVLFKCLHDAATELFLASPLILSSLLWKYGRHFCGHEKIPHLSFVGDVERKTEFTCWFFT